MRITAQIEISLNDFGAYFEHRRASDLFKMQQLFSVCTALFQIERRNEHVRLGGRSLRLATGKNGLVSIDTRIRKSAAATLDPPREGVGLEFHAIGGHAIGQQ